MSPLEPTPVLLLDYLYGLLDDPEKQPVEELLQSSPEWQRALATAKEQQQIFGEAAKTTFQDVRFEAPAQKVQTQPAAPTQELPAVPLRRSGWTRWALAASLLLMCLLGGGVAAFSWYVRYADWTGKQSHYAELTRKKNELANEKERAKENALAEMRRQQKQIHELEAKWKGETEKIRKQLNEQQLQVIITGPQTLQAGARNEYQIETRKPLSRRGSVPAPSDVEIQVVDPDANNQVLYQEKISNKLGRCSIHLPRDLPVKPGKQLQLQVVAVGKAGVKAEVKEKLPLVGRLYLTHLATDRPMYRPGEVVRFRSLTLDRFTLKPPTETFGLIYRIKGPRGNKVFEVSGTTHVVAEKYGQADLLKGADGRPIRGIGVGEFAIPGHLSGGVYTLEVSEANNRFPPERRTFIINKYQAPRLNKELEFNRKTYGLGDDVAVNLKVAPVAGGQPIRNQPVILQAFIDGQGRPFVTRRVSTKADGKLDPVRFTLPKHIERGGTVSVQFTDGANHETLVRPIPIIVSKLRVDFYPEGGDLVAGVPNRVYFEVRTPEGKPAEMQGRIVDQDGKEIAQIGTFHDDKEVGVNQGMGAFTFTPQADRRYHLKIDTPIGIKGQHVLPLPHKEGIVLHTSDGVVRDKINVVLRNTGKERNVLVGAYCRGRLIAHKRLTAKAGKETPVTFTLKEPAAGVYRLTVFEEIVAPNDRIHLVPKAERLIYRRPVQKLNLSITADSKKKVYSPGDRVTLKINSKDEKGKAAPAILLVSVVDKSIIKLADDKTDRSMPVHYYLTTEIKKPEDLEYADFLVSKHPKAEVALDLLLGTQGWRRFAEQDPKLFLRKQERDERPSANRLLLVNGLAQPKINNLMRQAQQQIDQQYAPKWQKEEEELAKMERQFAKKREALSTKIQSAQSKVSQAGRERALAQQHLKEHGQFLLQIGIAVFAIGFLIVAVACVIIGIMRTAREQRGGSAVLIGGAFALFLFLVVSGGAVLFVVKEDSHLHRTATSAQEKQQAFAPLAKDGPAGGPRGAEKGAARADKDGGPKMKMAMPGEGAAAPAPMEAVPENAKGAIPPKRFAPGPVNKQFDMNMAPAMAPAQGQMALQPMPPVGGGMGMMGGMGGMPGGLGAPGAGGVGMMGMMGMGGMNMAGGAPGGFGGGNLNGGFGGGFPGGPMAGVPGFGGGQRRPVMPNNLVAVKREAFLRQRGMYNQLAQRRLRRFGDQIAGLEGPAIPFVVREYAHHNKRIGDGIRRDFAETVYWHPVLVLPDGKGEVSFDLPDSVTTFRVLAWGHTLDGRLGAIKSEIVSRLPFSVEPKIPVEVTSSDKITIPVAIANETEENHSVKLTVSAENLKQIGSESQTVEVSANGKARGLFTFRPNVSEGEAKLVVTGTCLPFGKDSVERTFKIVPEGFPQELAKSGLLEGSDKHILTLPESWVKGSLKLKVQVFPSTLADLQKGLEAMLREPHGCFEQTSSSNYPNVMILSYLKESEQAAPETEKKARQLLNKGYGRLISYECRDPADKDKRGYEWFGGTAPPHEALTAYGLLQFGDMAKVGYPVDKKMLERTEKYLLAQRDGKGSFKRNSRALDSFGRAPQQITDAYIIWALTEYGTKEDLTKELQALEAKAKDSNDPYFLALVALGQLNAGKSKQALATLKKVCDLQKKDGHLEGKETSITSSRGRNLHIESTALAVLAWLRANRPGEFTEPVRKATEWIGKQRGGFGGFGSTQSTILALKALIAYTRENRKTAEAGELKLLVGGKQVDQFAFGPGYKGELIVRAKEDQLRSGKNEIEIVMEGKNQFPYTLSWSYNTLKPANPEKAPVQLSTRLNRTEATEGETVRLDVAVENKSGKGQGMTMAIIGLPAGLTVPEDMKQLKKLAQASEDGKTPGEISAFEIRDRELILYWRDLGPAQKINVTIDLICRIPGQFRGPASRTYLYYQSDLKYWAEPLAMTISPKGN